MTCYVIKKDDNQYYRDQLTCILRFESNILFAAFYEQKIAAEHTLDWIVNNKYRYNISRKQLKIVKVEIKELLENE